MIDQTINIRFDQQLKMKKPFVREHLHTKGFTIFANRVLKNYQPVFTVISY